MNLKYTFKGQIISVLLTHLKAAVIFFFVWIIAIAVTSSGVGGIIYSVISAIFYFMMMYSAGYETFRSDRKSYSQLTPFWYKGLILSTGVIVLNALILTIYKLSWIFGSDGTSVTSVWSFIGNFLGLFWFSPYLNLLGMASGNIKIYGYAIIFLLHTLACFLGYFAGYKNYDISAKLRAFMYEKKK